MKRTLIAVLFAVTAFATTTFAATPTSAPTLPADLEMAWEKVHADSCKKPNGVVVGRIFYRKKGAPQQKMLLFTKNGNLVAQYAENAYSIRQPDGSWMRHEETVGGEEEDAMNVVLTMTEPEYTRCLAQTK
ncbi:MAG: hypothetical protein A3D65_00005 [Candidatus Lloydbacteria bacterium RIFCSPHIGHO2_02_FULL_50_13]|uniref:Uncharacterized protein n=1 Tax=Candidatus Lloydbacteria bacterium RIFCSPHIGHO2_02_FULL_50_13 TaxID=1798661 RepID=A0A1G2D8E8_9BACT|nr:MAG: hypothetical protein A3D65_00005 [Candidatus Lloydbacteria bacterium RIFCSPHIGHO2_02_FULL_50_13]